MNLRFTRYKKEYFEQSANLMSQTWHFNEDLENPRDESLVFKAYFQHSLLESTYKDFLVDENGRVLGYLLASTPKKKNSLSARMKSGFQTMQTSMSLLWHLLVGSRRFW